VLKDLLNRLKEPAVEEDPAHLLALAAAALLLEVAWADHDIADAELALIEQHLESEFALSRAEVEELVAESRKAHEASVGLYSYTRTINDNWGEEQKFALVTALWRMALANDGLHHYEEHTIRKIAELLYLSHSRFIEAKLTARREA
jgi:uncharacterized tellurite resistance protein B-like protein